MANNTGRNISNQPHLPALDSFRSQDIQNQQDYYDKEPEQINNNRPYSPDPRVEKQQSSRQNPEREMYSNLRQANDRPVEIKISWYKKIWNLAVKKWWLSLLLLVFVLVSSLGTYAYILSRDVEDTSAYDRVKSTITAPPTLASGSVSTWSVLIENNEDIDILNVQLKLKFPEKSFQFSNTTSFKEKVDSTGSFYKINQIQAFSQHIIEFTGILTGEIDQMATISGEISYTPRPISSQENNIKSTKISPSQTRITAAEVSMEIDFDNERPQSGDELNITLNLKNQSDSELNDIEILINYPDSTKFKYISSQSTLSNSSNIQTSPDSGNNSWNIKSMKKSENYTIKVKGVVSGNENETIQYSFKIIKKNLEKGEIVLFQEKKSLQVVPQPLSIKTEIVELKNERFNYGDKIKVKTKFTNRSQRTIKNIVISSELIDPSNILDWTSFSKVGNDTPTISNDKKITWTPAGSSKLLSISPGKTQILEYQIGIKDEDNFLTTSLSQDKYTLTPIIKYKNDDGRVNNFTGKEYKTSGGLNFEQEVSYTNHPSEEDKRIYQIKWKFFTRQNSVKDIVLETSTPRVSSSFQPSSILPAKYKNNIQFDTVTGRIKMDLDKIEAYSGITKNPFVISFNMVIDKEAGSYDDILILQEIKIDATDDFTDESYSIKQNSLEAKE